MDPRLYQYAKSGNVNSLTRLLDYSPGILFKLTPQQNTALHIAAQFGHKEAVTEICRRCKPLLAKQNLDGDTPLHVAARGGYFYIVDFLVREILSSTMGDCSRNERISFGKFREILRLGNRQKSTVLHEAVRNGNLSVVHLLLKMDPELACFEDDDGDSPLYLAAREGMPEVVAEILASTHSSAHGGSGGRTALHVAVIQRHSDIMQALLRVKPHLVKEADLDGRTPLYYAASFGDHDTVRQLLQFDLSVAYELDKCGLAPLHVAARNGHVDTIREIIGCCPDSGEVLDIFGRSALHFGVLSGEANVVRCMLEMDELKGLTNRADENGNTPLHLAAMESKTWIVQCLLQDHRVNQRAKNKHNKTVFDIGNSTIESGSAFPTKRISIKRKSLIRFQSHWSVRQKGEAKANQELTKMQTYRQLGQTLLIIATLITTVTFAAAFTMPGGYNNNIGPGQGMALLGSTKGLRMFIVFDTVAMTSSITAACVLFWGNLVSKKKTYLYYLACAIMLTYIALQSTGAAFITGITIVLPPHQRLLKFSYVLVAFAFHTSTIFFVYHLVKFLKKSTKA